MSKEKYFELHSIGLGETPVKCAHGLTIVPSEPLSDLSKYDIVIVPGGGYLRGTTGVKVAAKNQLLLETIRKTGEAGKLICSVCTGAFVLAKSGILKGRKATTHYMVIEEMKSWAEGVTPVKQKTVLDGNVLTGAGISSSIDTGLKIVELVLGKNLASQVSEYMMYSPA